ncbi:hypothetical protein MSG28_001556 [Choristoneura fumiferana]|uniref:Uncharacterized protein n=1 Tax=Choristoneura fumiferana TaxID=7141 RepID=A0ACC0KVF3_CHOFU|nr:hypothetical protein MSG28_001556 [Choristoneura fumiferana]
MRGAAYEACISPLLTRPEESVCVITGLLRVKKKKGNSKWHISEQHCRAGLARLAGSPELRQLPYVSPSNKQFAWRSLTIPRTAKIKATQSARALKFLERGGEPSLPGGRK